MSLADIRAFRKTAEYKRSLERLKTAVAKDEPIDYSDVPPPTDAELAAMVRADQYRPVKRTVTIRFDSDVLEWLKKRSGGSGYQTQLNSLLRGLMLREAKR
jgi:uncharacterized protein (DUF4415 family)